MITADTLKWGSTLDAVTLTTLALGDSYTRKKNNLSKFTSARFLGITNGQEFCYSVAFDGTEGPTTAKVFVRKDPTGTRVIAALG